jgi:hypothetical protein
MSFTRLLREIKRQHSLHTLYTFSLHGNEGNLEWRYLSPSDNLFFWYLEGREIHPMWRHMTISLSFLMLRVLKVNRTFLECLSIHLNEQEEPLYWPIPQSVFHYNGTRVFFIIEMSIPGNKVLSRQQRTRISTVDSAQIRIKWQEREELKFLLIGNQSQK